MHGQALTSQCFSLIILVGVVPSPGAKITGSEIPGVLVESIVGTSFGAFDVFTTISINFWIQ